MCFCAPSAVQGSSPLTRGKPSNEVGRGVIDGLIPAHAGKTSARSLGHASPWAHPRSYGENTETASWWISSTGSSPLMRGKPDRRHRRPVRPRLIPAHAGKPSSGSRRASGGRAHPRSCGENSARFGVERRDRGSSPLMRGKRVLQRDERVEVGLIPTHAGKILPDLRFYRADRSDLGKP